MCNILTVLLFCTVSMIIKADADKVDNHNGTNFTDADLREDEELAESPKYYDQGALILDTADRDHQAWLKNVEPKVPTMVTRNISSKANFTSTLQLSEFSELPAPNQLNNELDAYIDYNIFGDDFDETNVTIGPTGTLLQLDDESETSYEPHSIEPVSGFGAVNSFSFSCDKPFQTPKMPDFRVRGRRISEVRCYEYIWQLRVRHDRENWNLRCNNHHIRSRSLNVTNLSPITYAPAFIGGFSALPEQFPHMAAVGWRGINDDVIFKCGASLISPNYLLTAAHCTATGPDSRIVDPIPRIARIGGTNLGYKINGEAFTALRRRRRQASSPGQIDVNIINIINHEKYNPNKRYYDIALMQLEYSLDFSKNLQPACLWTDHKSSSRIKKAVASGWGVLDARSYLPSLNLQAGQLDIIDVETCNSLLQASFGRKFHGFADHQLCAGKLSGGVDVCQGDSGGPLQVKIQLPIRSEGSMHTILGVISAGVGCAKPNTPGVYTRITSFIDWIEQRVWL